MNISSLVPCVAFSAKVEGPETMARSTSVAVKIRSNLLPVLISCKHFLVVQEIIKSMFVYSCLQFVCLSIFVNIVPPTKDDDSSSRLQASPRPRNADKTMRGKPLGRLRQKRPESGLRIH